MHHTPQSPVLDLHPQQSRFLDAVITGLSQSPKRLPTAFLYDEQGSHLFDRICELDEYYPTRTEMRIMDAHLPEMAKVLGPSITVIEYGSGSGIKTKRLLEALDHPTAYVPVEISREHLMMSAKELAKRFPNIEVLPVCADFTQPFDVPSPQHASSRRVIYFPGSTIGNFTPSLARTLLEQMADEVGAGGGVLLGVDLIKDEDVLRRAYNDQKGVTAEFNLNLLRRINRELEANFNLSTFEHTAYYDRRRHAVEMRLVSTTDQTIEISTKQFQIRAGEWIHTEDSHKYSLDGFQELARSAGLDVQQVWTDEQKLFSVQYLVSTS